jgi:DNA-binding transcriptional MerR regulator
MKIGELAQQSSLSAHTLRYYEHIGLLPRAHRNSSRQRDYDDSILIWIEFLRRLKTTGMSIKGMLRYAKLREKGPSTETERQNLLEVHRDQVKTHLVELQNCLLVLDGKIAGYARSTKQRKANDVMLRRK